MRSTLTHTQQRALLAALDAELVARMNAAVGHLLRLPVRNAAAWRLA